MYLLVDFENVRSGGLRGVDYLEEGDYLTIFFSDAACKCENRTHGCPPIIESLFPRLLSEV